MSVILNKWVEKEKNKRSHETAPSYEFDTKDTWVPATSSKTPKRHTNAARATYRQTLRGIRK